MMNDIDPLRTNRPEMEMELKVSRSKRVRKGRACSVDPPFRDLCDRRKLPWNSMRYECLVISRQILEVVSSFLSNICMYTHSHLALLGIVLSMIRIRLPLSFGVLFICYRTTPSSVFCPSWKADRILSWLTESSPDYNLWRSW